MPPGLQNFVRGRASPAPAAEDIPSYEQQQQQPPQTRSQPLDSSTWKEKLPSTSRGKHGSNERPSLGNQRHVGSAQHDELKDAYDTDVGSVVDTTTDLTEPLGEHVRDAHQVVERPKNGHPQYAEVMTKDGGVDSNGDDDTENEDDDVIEWKQFGKYHRVSKHEDPVQHAEVMAIVAQRNAAASEADSYPDTTSGRPSSVASEHLKPQPQSAVEHPTVRNAVAAQQQFQLPEPAKLMQNYMREQRQRKERVRRAQNSLIASRFDLHHAQQLHELGPFHAPEVPLHNHEPPSGRLLTERARYYKLAGLRGGGTSPRHRRSASRNMEPGTASAPMTTIENRPIPILRHEVPMMRAKNIDFQDMLSKIPSGSPEPSVGSHDSELKLDYDEEGLFHKKFEELQADDYDIDPRGRSKEPVKLTEDMLREQLDALVKSDAERQKEFCSSLNMEEWEQAGDWFVDQFSDMLKKFKEKRREKRQLSRGFEAEISARHLAVSKKRQLTDEALKAMKGAGAHILDTPKKMKHRA